MTNINDLELRIESAEATLEMLRGDLEDLKKQEQEQEQENLLGRWATHPEYGRGIIVSCKPDADGEVRFAYGTSRYTDHVDTRFVLPESLDLDPLTLTTLEDYRNAPFGTIIECPDGDVYVGDSIEWHGYSGEYGSKAMVSIGTSRVIRWGNGQ